MSKHSAILEDIKVNPHKHKHPNLNALHACCIIDGAMDLEVLDAHEGIHGYNGGVGCDVSSGPCSCGAFH